MSDIVSLVENLTEYLSEHRKSNGGWAEIMPEDIPLLNNIIGQIISMKFEADFDGDYPIESILVDRTVERAVYPVTLPYHTNFDNPMERGGKLSKLITGIKIMTTDLANELTHLQSVESQRKEKESSEKST